MLLDDSGDDAVDEVDSFGRKRKLSAPGSPAVSEGKIKIALSLYKVQQNIYLLDFQRVDVSEIQLYSYLSTSLMILTILILIILLYCVTGRCVRLHEVVRVHHHGTQESLGRVTGAGASNASTTREVVNRR